MKDCSTFFITGLPRSRTAWLANLFTSGNSFCFHDALKWGVNVECLQRRFEVLKSNQGGIRFIGDSDSALTIIAKDVTVSFPKSKWLIVNRNPADAEASYRKFFTGRDPYVSPQADIHSIFQKAVELLDAAKRCIPPDQLLQIDFKSLENIDMLQKIWEWLVGCGFNKERARMLNTIQINPFPEKVWDL